MGRVKKCLSSADGKDADVQHIHFITDLQKM